MHFSKKLILAAVACLAPVLSQAAPVGVPVTPSPSLSVGGLDFSGFSCDVTKGGVLAGFASPSNCGDIHVATITSPGVGIMFNSGFNAPPASFDDVFLSYHVSSTVGGISSVGLDFNGILFGYAIGSVTETVYTGDKTVVAKVSCAPNGLGGCSPSDLSTNISLGGEYKDLYITKDIQMNGYLGAASASIINQTFATDAPEPGSTALLGGGLLGIVGLLRRRMLKK